LQQFANIFIACSELEPNPIETKMSVDQRDVNMRKKAEVQEAHRKSDIFFAPFDPRFPNQNQTRYLMVSVHGRYQLAPRVSV
jgi:hypothetical protein